ncbi:head-tail connector protein [Pseudomonas sp. NFACC13-1]|uniref:head-tail connector protein n=1 Tax=Pseudomonas sp. NFACC13-1 TaxID=1566245 RepID=UPI0008908552|nr:head-tail connector protein [Pseudomonas sp. NFACC13-1]SDB54396.1 hypothetical protein SAMN03159290_04190 [Pseudomonas sp. NFACC13-1]
MSVIDIELAMKHLLAEPEDQALVQAQLDAAEEAAQQFLHRRFYVDQAALDEAQLDVIQRTRDARGVLAIAADAANAVENLTDRCRLKDQALERYTNTIAEIDMVANGIVINAAITAACLLKLGHLFANREEVVVGVTAEELPHASKSLLMPYRIRMGV